MQVASFLRSGAPVQYLGSSESGDMSFVITLDDCSGFVEPADTVLQPRAAAALTWASPGGDVLAQARSLAHFHMTHSFCSNCGGRTVQQSSGQSRACLSCDMHSFPNPAPSVIMTVVDKSNDHVLLATLPRSLPETYSLLAGFVDPGESVEEAVMREAMEEAGVKIVPDSVQYLASQPWPFPNSLMIGCHCVADVEVGETRVGLDIDRTELSDAKWFDRDSVKAMLLRSTQETSVGVKVPGPLTIAHRLLKHWV